jgi:hypothetical protein
LVPLLAALVTGCTNGPKGEPQEPEPYHFVVEALSRGKGVPAETRAALEECIRLLELEREGGGAVSFSRSMIGIEGETRLQVEFADPRAGREMLQRFLELTAGRDLINVNEVGGD